MSQQLKNMSPQKLTFWAAIMAHTLLGAILSFVPLFNLLGYEYCFAATLLAAPTSMLIGFTHQGSLIRVCCRSVVSLCGGLLLISLNALRIRNCDFAEGLMMFLLLPIPTSIYGALLGRAVKGLTLKRSPTVQTAAFLSVLAAPMLWSAWNFLWHPPIFVFDHLWGYFAGSLYDERITLGRAHIAWRAGTLLRIVGLWWLVVSLNQASWVGTKRVLLGSVAFVCAIAGVESLLGPWAGFRITRGDIEKVLSKTIQKGQVLTHLHPSVSDELAQQVALDQQFRLQQLKETLNVEPEHAIHIYVYPNPEEKYRLMGARTTMFAKPWLREAHVHHAKVPHYIMQHELVHVVASEFGSPVLGVSARYGILVNMGIVEGLAEALTVERHALDLDRWAKSLKEMGIAPNMRAILGPAGFWSQAASRAYTVAGSFFRFLLREYGASPVRDVYRDGDFQRAFGKSLDTLVVQWEQYLGTIELSPREQRLAQERFRHRSIFSRPCARTISALRDRANTVSPAETVAVYESIAEHLGHPVQARIDIAFAALEAQQQNTFVEQARKLLNEDLADTQRAELHASLGEVSWEAGKLDEARQHFESVIVLKHSLDAERLNWVRLWALDKDPEVATVVREFVAGKRAPLAAVLFLQTHPELQQVPTAKYLIARQLHRVGDYSQAESYLQDMGPHVFPPIEAERRRLLADILYQREQYAQAATAFEEYAQIAPLSGEAARARDWAARSRFMAQQYALK